MISLTGFTNDAFDYFLAKFAPVYDEYSPLVGEDRLIVKKLENMGRPCSIHPEDCLGLGLMLAWSHTRFYDGSTAYLWRDNVSPFKISTVF